MPETHALLSPSAAKRWMTCTPSAQLEAGIPDEGSSFAREGTLAHALAQEILERYKRSGRTSVIDGYADIVRGQLQDHGLDEVLSQHYADIEREGYDFFEMLETVHDGYVAIVWQDFLEAKAQEPDTELRVEVQLDLSQFIPGGFGTADAIIAGGRRLRVYDLKYGKGVKVDAVENPQIMCYGLGALLAFDFLTTDVIEMHIIQPRLHHSSQYEQSTEELIRWGFHELHPVAERASRGEGPYVPGNHCRFCRAAARCIALRDSVRVIVAKGGQPELLSSFALAESLSSLDMVKAWVKSVEDWALNRALQGHSIPGFKLVEGRSVRVITDQEAAIKALHEAGFEDSVILKPRELRTITDLERLLKKKAFAELLGSYVSKPAGNPALAPESDPRPAYTVEERAADAFADLVI